MSSPVGLTIARGALHRPPTPWFLGFPSPTQGLATLHFSSFPRLCSHFLRTLLLGSLCSRHPPSTWPCVPCPCRASGSVLWQTSHSGEGHLDLVQIRCHTYAFTVRVALYCDSNSHLSSSCDHCVPSTQGKAWHTQLCEHFLTGLVRGQHRSDAEMPVKLLPCSPASLGRRALVHMAIFSSSDLTPSNTCESAWQGHHPPPPL